MTAHPDNPPDNPVHQLWLEALMSVFGDHEDPTNVTISLASAAETVGTIEMLAVALRRFYDTQIPAPTVRRLLAQVASAAGDLDEYLSDPDDWAENDDPEEEVP